MSAPICKDCKAEWERRSEGPPKVLRPAPYRGPRCASHFRQKTREVKSTAHERHVQRTYNMEPGEYDELYRFQDDHCYICQRATGATKKLAVDHDHKCCPKPPTCGECTRGELCGPCNKLIGHVRDNPETLRRAAHYLIDPPYRRMKRSQ